MPAHVTHLSPSGISRCFPEGLRRRAGMGQAGRAWQQAVGSILAVQPQAGGRHAAPRPCSCPIPPAGYPEDQSATSIVHHWDRPSCLSLSLCTSDLPLPGTSLFPQNSGLGKFPVCAPSNGPGHPESWHRDVLTSPSPTSPASLVLVTQFHWATWATSMIISIPKGHQHISRISQLPARACCRCGRA